MSTLFVCTGNACRSPMAVALLRHHLAARGVEEEVSSAGLVTGDRAATDEAVAVLAARDVTVGGHHSRRLTPAIVGDADLIVGMAREHARAVFGVDDAALARTVTVKELVRRAAVSGIREPGEPLTDWVTRLTADRDPADMLGSSPDDDIDDPLGRPRRVYESLADELDHLTGRMVHLAWPAPFYGELIPAS
ncbi:MAG TPA: hypothetical protein VFF40_06600 [Acidimicrobiia bacterium]|nr:hypothetical protein [Acidimicrobiia bacterium]